MALFLCVDGGGTSTKVCITDRENVIQGSSGPSNVKQLGYPRAFEEILKAIEDAAAQSTTIQVNSSDLKSSFAKIWVAIAGVNSDKDIEDFTIFLIESFGMQDRPSDIRVTNDRELLLTPFVMDEEYEYALLVISGTGSASALYHKIKNEFGVECVGVSGGWGYLLGDEGSAYDVGKIAIQHLLRAQDNSQHQKTGSSQKQTHPLEYALFQDIIQAFNVNDVSGLLARIYADSSHSDQRENGKSLIAQLCPTVFRHAFSLGDKTALAIIHESVTGLIEHCTKLLNIRSDRQNTLVILGGSLWKEQGYLSLFREGVECLSGVDFLALDDAVVKGAKMLPNWVQNVS